MVSVAASRAGHAAHMHSVRGSSILAGIDFANDNALSFQSEYTEAMKHFLLIGFLGMFVGAIVFVFMSFQRNQKMLVWLSFLISSVWKLSTWAQVIDLSRNPMLVSTGHHHFPHCDHLDRSILLHDEWVLKF
jgi:hypothetical protein